jgi:hypothetical protein
LPPAGSKRVVEVSVPMENFKAPVENFKAYLTKDYNLVKSLPFYADDYINDAYVYDVDGKLVRKFYIDNKALKISVPLENYYWMDDKPLRELIKPYMEKVILKLQELFSKTSIFLEELEKGNKRLYDKYKNDREAYEKFKIMEEIGSLFRYEKRMWKLARGLSGLIWGWNNSGMCNKVLIEKQCINLECEDGKDKIYIQALSCGRMWCPICGQPFSLAHLECYLKFLAILMVLRSLSKKQILGLLIITFPAEKRMELANKYVLSEIRTAIRDLLCPGKRPLKIAREIAEKYGINVYPALFDVWHFAGEKSSPRYHPHLNVVLPVEDGYWQEEYLENVRKAISELSCEVLGFSANVWYGYKTEGKEIEGALIDSDSIILHLARYLSRPTFLLQNEVSCEEFEGMQKYGHRGLRGLLHRDDTPKSGEVIRQMVEMMEKNGEIKSERQKFELLIRMGRCPFCFERMQSKRIKEFYYEEGDVIEISGGVYMIIRPPPPQIDDWEPGMNDVFYITEEDKKLIEEMEKKEREGG